MRQGPVVKRFVDALRNVFAHGDRLRPTMIFHHRAVSVSLAQLVRISLRNVANLVEFPDERQRADDVRGQVFGEVEVVRDGRLRVGI
jgi:hypothetical protein